MTVVLARYEGTRGMEWAMPGLVASSGQGIVLRLSPEVVCGMRFQSQCSTWLL
jgi:hypothetical protein